MSLEIIFVKYGDIVQKCKIFVRNCFYNEKAASVLNIVEVAVKIRVFVIDDEECIRDTFKMYLEDQGHEVLTSDRPSGCAVFQGHDCKNDLPCAHALFVDYFLPEMNGLEFIEKMQKGGCKGMLRNTILMSGDSTAIDIKNAEKLGCMVVQKPLTFDKLDKIMDIIKSTVDLNKKLADLPI